ncbi:MAG TPA: glycosyltransferase family 39 protein [Candidatus Sulfotelmatobacter sp.]|nr:glycosyltransferase family 39 protein [Candidatus Sulfotelmatobacter sp.]
MPRSEVSSQTALPIPQTTPGKLHWLSLLLLLAASIAVRMYCLSCKPFWFDECYSVELALIGRRNFLRLLWWREANMSLYYVLLRLWLHFGQNPFFIRSLSVLVAVATLPAVYWLARMLYDRRVALIAAALLAFNAYDVRYAQEARSYALFVLLATLSSAILVALLREPTRRKRVSYAIVAVLSVYAHLYALLLIVAQWIAMSLVSRSAFSSSELTNSRNSQLEAGNVIREMRRVWTVIAVAVAPLLIFVAKTGAGPIRWIHRPGLRDVLAFFEHLAGSDHGILLVVLAAACLAAIIPARNRLLKRNQEWGTWRCQFLLIWLLFPVVLTIVLSFARPVFLGRYMIFCLPPLLILASAGLARLQRWWLLALALSAILLLSAQGISFVYGHDFDNERDASGAATNFILDHAQSGDGVIFHIAATRVPYEFFRSLRAGQNTASAQFTASFGPEILYPRHAAGLDYRDFTGKPTADLLHSLTAGHPRVWVMLMDNGPRGKPDPTTVMLSQVLAESFPQVQRWQFPLVEVRLYSKP